MFTLCIDNDGYYTTGITDNLVQVADMPTVTDVKQLLAYRYNTDKSTLEVDEEKLDKINAEIANPSVELTTEERLTDLENAFLELSAMMLEGD